MKEFTLENGLEVMNRNDYILGRINRNGRGLEIGPSYNPVTPKSEGWNVKTADHADASSLRLKYAAWNIDASKIEDVDYIIDDRGLAGSIGPDRFDWIIASHVIEHTPDLIRFLQGCEDLLIDDGVLSLVIPDKRFCFDIFQPPSTTGQILEAYWTMRKRHSLASIFDTMAGQVSRGGALAWPSNSTGAFQAVTTVHDAFSNTLRYMSSESYLDSHAWRFVPASFSLIMHDLQTLGMTKFGILAEANFNEFEFFISLKKGHSNQPYERLDMLSKIAQECAAESN